MSQMVEHTGQEAGGPPGNQADHDATEEGVERLLQDAMGDGKEETGQQDRRDGLEPLLQGGLDKTTERKLLADRRSHSDKQEDCQQRSPFKQALHFFMHLFGGRTERIKLLDPLPQHDHGRMQTGCQQDHQGQYSERWHREPQGTAGAAAEENRQGNRRQGDGQHLGHDIETEKGLPALGRGNDEIGEETQQQDYQGTGEGSPHAGIISSLADQLPEPEPQAPAFTIPEQHRFTIELVNRPADGEETTEEGHTQDRQCILQRQCILGFQQGLQQQHRPGDRDQAGPQCQVHRGEHGQGQQWKADQHQRRQVILPFLCTARKGGYRQCQATKEQGNRDQDHKHPEQGDHRRRAELLAHLGRNRGHLRGNKEPGKTDTGQVQEGRGAGKTHDRQQLAGHDFTTPGGAAEKRFHGAPFFFTCTEVDRRVKGTHQGPEQDQVGDKL